MTSQGLTPGTEEPDIGQAEIADLSRLMNLLRKRKNLSKEQRQAIRQLVIEELDDRAAGANDVRFNRKLAEMGLNPRLLKLIKKETQSLSDAGAFGTDPQVDDPDDPLDDPDDDDDGDIRDNDPTGDPDPGDRPVGETDEFPGVLNGGTLTKVRREGADDIWLMAFEWPRGSGKFVAWQFDSVDQLEQVFGEKWWESIPVTPRNENFFQNNITVLDSVDEITGLTGDFNGLMDDTMRQAALLAGVNDPTLVGLIANDPEWQEIIAVAGLGNWTDAQLTAELRQTSLWQNTLYPGIANLYGQTSEPEQAWAAYRGSVEDSLGDLGYARDPDGTYNSIIGDMLNKGIDDDLWNQSVGTFIRAESSTEFRSALDKWTQDRLGKSLEFGDWFDLLAGETSPEIAEVAELAQLQFQIDQTGSSIGDEALLRIAANTDLSEGAAAAAFNKVEQGLLAIGDENLSRFGLTKDDLIAASTGISATSGRSTEQIRLSAQKAAFQMGLSDNVETELFVGFDPDKGTPERPGLNALAPEGA